MNDVFFMQIAIKEAKKADFPPLPNPRVGAVLVDKNGQVLSTGFHAKAGEAHAERIVLNSWESVPEGATLYITLEPCNTFGKTPPCLDLLLQKKVTRIVIGTLDPNPLVCGQSIAILKEKGIDVTTGVLEQECSNLSLFYNKIIQTKQTFVSAKTAISLDGKIAMPSGESQWITSQAARNKTHQLRSLHESIAIGETTLNIDNPQLTDRVSEKPRNPYQILFTNTGNIPVESNFYQNQKSTRFIFASQDVDSSKLKQWEQQGFHVFQSDTKLFFPPAQAKKILYENNIYSLLIEGGGGLISSFLQADCLDRLYIFQSGKIIGSSQAPGWCDNLAFTSLADVPHFKIKKQELLVPDLLSIWEPY